MSSKAFNSQKYLRSLENIKKSDINMVLPRTKIMSNKKSTFFKLIKSNIKNKVSDIPNKNVAFNYSQKSITSEEYDEQILHKIRSNPFSNLKSHRYSFHNIHPLPEKPRQLPLSCSPKRVSLHPLYTMTCFPLEPHSKSPLEESFEDTPESKSAAEFLKKLASCLLGQNYDNHNEISIRRLNIKIKLNLNSQSKLIFF